MDLRCEHAQTSPPRWRQAERYARWLRRVPFVRLMTVCGSQAIDNAPAAGDVDFFCITAPRRLWLVQMAAMLLRRPAALGGVEICPNYFLAEDALALAARDLYTAHEALQVVPLWGRDAYVAFRDANAWTAELLPGFDVSARLERLTDLEAPRLTRRLERALGGRAGEALDRLVHRALLGYYSVRLWRHRFGRGALREAYRRDRQVVVGGGYAGAVVAAFRRRVRERLPAEAIPEELLERLFPPRGALVAARETTVGDGVTRLYGRLLAQSYGARADGAPRRGEP